MLDQLEAARKIALVIAAADALLGAVEGRGMQQVLGALQYGRINIAARSVGVSQRAYEDALAYRQARHARGLEDEIALLRLKIFVLHKTTENNGSEAQAPVLARLIDLLIKALRADGASADDDRVLLDSLLDEESARILATAREK